MSYQKKQQAALVRRTAEHKEKHPVNGMHCRKPGSQNRKKGYGLTRGSKKH